MKRIFIRSLLLSLDARVIFKMVGLILSVLGLIFVLLAFISVKPVMNYYAPQYWGYANIRYPAGVYYMEGWYAPNGTTLIFEWKFSKDVHVYAVEYNVFSKGVPFSDYLAHTYAEEGSMTVYVNEKGDYVFAAYSPEDFSRYYINFKAIHPIAVVEKDDTLAYFGALVSLIGILVLIFPKRWSNSTG